MSLQQSRTMSSRITFKIADRKEEFEQIHRLNYETFVEEIPQHAANDSGVLVDKYHFKNHYAIAIQHGELIGMVAFSDVRPFSLDYKIPDIQNHLPPFEHAIEIRLLSVKPHKRGGTIFFKLVGKIAEWLLVQEKDYKFVLISGTTRQIKLYEKLGFKSFYKLVGNDGAWFQPMYLDPKKFVETYAEKLRISN